MPKKDAKKPSSKKSTKPLSAYHQAKKEECARLKEELMADLKAPKVGRPSDYNEEMANYIIDRVASSKVGLHVLCKIDPKLPCQDTINQWRWLYPEFSSKYLLAKQHQTQLMAEFCEELSDEKATYIDPLGSEKVDPGHVQSQRLRIDTRKWYASKINPNLFGDRKLVEEIKNQNEDLKAELMALRAELSKKNERDY